MKNSLIILCSVVLLVSSCNSSKTTNSNQSNVSNLKANLIDGSWEVTNIINTPKPFNELYAQLKPKITFNSKDGHVSGITGCNNFTGKFSLDGSKLSWSTGMAVTRKICADMDGEQIFLETFQKVNAYSVSEKGNILQLLVDNTIVMSLKNE